MKSPSDAGIPNEISFGAFTLNRKQECVYLNGKVGQTVALQHGEFKLLEVLAVNLGDWCNVEDIGKVWNVVNVTKYCSTLRAKLGARLSPAPEFRRLLRGAGVAAARGQSKTTRGAGWLYIKTRTHGLIRLIDPSPKKEDAPAAAPGVEFRDHPDLAEKTYFYYRDLPVPGMDAPELIDWLASRYKCEPVRIGRKAYPVTIVWRSLGRGGAPNSVLGRLAGREPIKIKETVTLNADEYETARQCMKTENERGEIKYEGEHFCMTRLTVRKRAAKINGTVCRFYDNLLTQYALEWELKKALLTGSIKTLDKYGTLPLRTAIEQKGDPLRSGHGRTTLITVSTLTVFKREATDSYYCLIHRRSQNVAVSPGLLHVVPAGMFEQKNRHDPWSVEKNVWRELLEEVYNEKEQQGAGTFESEDGMLRKPPIPYLRKLIAKGKADLRVTGICVDLLNLRPEICTILFVPDHRFPEEREMRLNWEYHPETIPNTPGRGLVPWENVGDFIASSKGFTASGAACLKLGQEWLTRNHKM